MMNPGELDRTSPTASAIDRLLEQVGRGSHAEQMKLLEELVRISYPRVATVNIFNRLASVKPHKQLALEFVAGMPEPIPPAVLLLASQAIQDRNNTVLLRLNVAGKLLASVPDKPLTVGPIVRSLTAGLSRTRSLERMLQLQSRVDRCQTLDEMVDTAIHRVKLKCPRCMTRLSRLALPLHLWKKHRLILVHGAVRETLPILDRTVSIAAEANNATDVERAYQETSLYFPTSTTIQVLQAITARQRPSGLLPEPLMKEAQEQRSSRCPSCLSLVPDKLPALPPPLALGEGRLAGEDYSVDVQETSTGRVVRVTWPDEVTTTVAGRYQRFSPRGYAVFVSSLFFILLMGLSFLVPSSRVSPFLLTLLIIALSFGAYWMLRLTRARLPDADHLAIDVAWRSVVPELIRDTESRTFLSRLCRVSLGRGDSIVRHSGLKALLKIDDEYAPEALMMRSAARVLQLSDSDRGSRDRLTAWLDLFEPFYSGRLTPLELESISECLVNSRELPPTELRLVAVGLVTQAFEVGLYPDELATIAKYLPWFRLLLGRPTVEWLRASYIIWKARNSQPWSSAGQAKPLCDLVKDSPAVARRLLANHAESLLRLSLSDVMERELGEVVLTPSGLFVAGIMIRDSAATLDVVRSPRGSGWQLVLGHDRVQLDRKVHGDVLNTLWAWIRYWESKLMPQVQQIRSLRPERIERLLKSMVSPCPFCGIPTIGRTGQIADRWPLA